MRAVLFGPTAVAWWLVSRAHQSAMEACRVSFDDVSAPSVSVWRRVSQCHPVLAQPLHFVAQDATWDRRGRWCSHVSHFSPYGKAFYEIGEGLYIPNPELAFIQSCPLLSVHESLKIGSALCGSFRLDASSRMGLQAREPLTTPRRIKREAQRLQGMHGTRQALKIADQLSERAASPAEVFLAMALHCPPRLGGYGLPPSQLNARIRPSKHARRIARRQTLVPDMLWKKERLVVEFDSDAVHLTGRQIARDASKRMALNGDGYHVITVTTRQMKSPLAMDDIAHEIALRLGIPFRQRSKRFRQQQVELFRAGWSLNGLFSTG